jgi:hypothetical protein
MIFRKKQSSAGIVLLRLYHLLLVERLSNLQGQMVPNIACGGEWDCCRCGKCDADAQTGPNKRLIESRKIDSNADERVERNVITVFVSAWY